MEKLGIQKISRPVADEVATARHVRMPHEKPFWPDRDQGSITKRFGEFTLNIEYRKMPGVGEGIAKILKESQDTPPEIRDKAEHYVAREFMGIVNLSILDKDESPCFLLSRDLPGYYVFIAREDEKSLPLGENLIEHTNRYVLIAGDITNITCISALLHEVGHFVVRQASSDEENRRLREVRGRSVRYPTLSVDDLKILVNNERAAWAYALGIMRPLLGREERKFLVRHLHDFALKSYEQIPITTKSIQRLEIEGTIQQYLATIRRFFGYTNRNEK